MCWNKWFYYYYCIRLYLCKMRERKGIWHQVVLWQWIHVHQDIIEIKKFTYLNTNYVCGYVNTQESLFYIYFFKSGYNVMRNISNWIVVRLFFFISKEKFEKLCLFCKWVFMQKLVLGNGQVALIFSAVKLNIWYIASITATIDCHIGGWRS